MRYAALICLAGCGGGSADDTGDKPPVEVTTTFTVDATLGGKGPSPLDVLAGQPVSIDVVLTDLGFGTSEKDGCKTQTGFVQDSERTATGPTADVVQSMILDLLPAWDVDVSVCDDGTAIFQLNGDVDVLNTRFICATVPASAAGMVDARGFPFLTTFTASSCTTDILDVVNNRDLTASGFSMTLTTGSGQLPE